MIAGFDDIVTPHQGNRARLAGRDRRDCRAAVLLFLSIFLVLTILNDINLDLYVCDLGNALVEHLDVDRHRDSRNVVRGCRRCRCQCYGIANGHVDRLSVVPIRNLPFRPGGDEQFNPTQVSSCRVPLDAGVHRITGGRGVNRRGVDQGLYLGFAEDNPQVCQFFLPHVFNLSCELYSLAGHYLCIQRGDVLNRQPVAYFDGGRD